MFGFLIKTLNLLQKYVMRKVSKENAEQWKLSAQMD